MRLTRYLYVAQSKNICFISALTLDYFDPIKPYFLPKYYMKCPAYSLPAFRVAQTAKRVAHPWCKFHQHFLSGFQRPIFLQRKSTYLKCKYKKNLCTKLLYKKAARNMLVKFTIGLLIKDYNSFFTFRVMQGGRKFLVELDSVNRKSEHSFSLSFCWFSLSSNNRCTQTVTLEV